MNAEDEVPDLTHPTSPRPEPWCALVFDRPQPDGGLVAWLNGRHGAKERPQAGRAGRTPRGYEQSGGATFAHERRVRPIAVGDLADFGLPESALDPLSAAFHAFARTQEKFRDLFSPEHPAGYRERQRGKAALAWCTIGGGPMAHYSLRGVEDAASMRALATKTSAEDDPQGKFDPTAHAPLTRHTKSRSTVGAELRWLFRYRRVSAVRERVRFWRADGSGFAACPPPWEWPGEVGAAWQAYRPTREYVDGDVDVAPAPHQETKP